MTAIRTVAMGPMNMTTVVPTIMNTTDGMPTTDTSLFESIRPWSITREVLHLFVITRPSFTAETLGASTELVHSVYRWRMYAMARLNVGRVTISSKALSLTCSSYC